MKFTIDNWFDWLIESFDCASLTSKLKLELEFCGEIKNGDLLLKVLTTDWLDCEPTGISDWAL